MKDTICENTDVSRFILHLLSKAEYQSRSPFQMISNRGKQFLLPRVCLYWTYRTFGNPEPDTTGCVPLIHKRKSASGMPVIRPLVFTGVRKQLSGTVASSIAASRIRQMM